MHRIQPESAELPILATGSDCLSVRGKICRHSPHNVCDNRLLCLLIPDGVASIQVADREISPIWTDGGAAPADACPEARKQGDLAVIDYAADAELPIALAIHAMLEGRIPTFIFWTRRLLRIAKADICNGEAGDGFTPQLQRRMDRRRFDRCFQALEPLSFAVVMTHRACLRYV